MIDKSLLGEVAPDCNVQEPHGDTQAVANARPDEPNQLAPDPLAPDLNTIREYIYALCDPAFALAHPYAAFEVAYAHPVYGDGDLNRAQTYSALSDEDLAWAAKISAKWNAMGYNVYAGAALRWYGERAIPPDRRATVDNYLASRFAWVDFDKAGDAERIEAVLKDKGIVPFLVVTTGTIPHRRGQLYFLVSGVRDAAHLRDANSALQRLLGTDPAVVSAPQVLRLAGSVNYPTAKKAARGYVAELTTLKKIADAPTYSADHLISLAGPTSEAPTGTTEQRQHYDRRAADSDDYFGAFDDLRFEADPELVASALEFVPNRDLEWLEWKRILLAAWRATNGSPVAFKAIDKWSRKSSKYDADTTKNQWDKIAKSPPSKIGAGTIFKLASDNGWERPRRAFVGKTADGWIDFNYADPKPNEPRADLEEVIDLFDAAQPLRGTLGETYLSGLGLKVPDTALQALRFHPHCPFGDVNLPCLVAYVQDSLTNAPAGLHLTALGADAAVIDRKVIGAIDCYSVIKLGGDLDASGELAIAASIETALSAMMFGFTPAWSVLSVEGIAAFTKPRITTVKRLTVIVDSDDAVEAAKKCKARWGNVARIVARSV
jgi:hypothetical protein